MSKPVILLAERNKELRDRLFCQLLCQGFDVIKALSMSDVFRALRHRQDISLFIISMSLDTPRDGVEFAYLVGLHGYSPRVILTAPPAASDRITAAAQERELSSSVEYKFSYDDIIASVQRSR